MAKLLSTILTFWQVANIFLVITHCDKVDFDASEVALQKAILIEERCNIRILLQNIIMFTNTSESLYPLVDIIENTRPQEFIESTYSPFRYIDDVSRLMGPPAYR